MTPVFLNPPPSPNFPFVELKENTMIFSFFFHDPLITIVNVTGSVESLFDKFIESEPWYQVKKYEGGSSDQQQVSSSSSSSLQSMVDHKTINGQDSSLRDYESAGDSNGISVKWMSSKMRLMKKMMNSHHNNKAAVKFTHKFQYPMNDYTSETNYSLGKANSNAIRVCSDCNTTTTPLWRSGPRGPKSLCNACGIRQRKARRAMEAVALTATPPENGSRVEKDGAMSMKINKVHNNNNNNKDKKSRIGKFKKQQFKAASDNYNNNINQQTQKKLCLKEFALSLARTHQLCSVCFLRMLKMLQSF